jgi:hypothetical protein
MTTLLGPIDRGQGKLVLELGTTRFEVTPAHGARISSLRCEGQELLVQNGSSNFEDAVGSTFWPSPQTWPWPPPAEIDHEPYAATIDARGAITLVGQPHEGTGLRVTKTFSANLAREAIELTYAMTNTTEQAVSWAPWEITRMPATGLAFWPTGGTPFGGEPMPTETAHGQTWCAPGQTDGEGKVFADGGGGGYLAYAVGGYILIKHFADTSPSQAAPGEAEIELYVNADHSYVEVENQGAYASIAPGATVTWRVTWYARKLPPGSSAAAPHADLVAFVSKTLQ